MLLPTELDTAMSPYPFRATMTLVMRSGMLVPAARNVRPITSGGMATVSPATFAHQTIRYEYAAIQKIEPMNVIGKNFFPEIKHIDSIYYTFFRGRLHWATSTLEVILRIFFSRKSNRKGDASVCDSAECSFAQNYAVSHVAPAFYSHHLVVVSINGSNLSMLSVFGRLPFETLLTRVCNTKNNLS